MSAPRLLVFSSGTKDGGGSGLRELLRNARTGVLHATIVAVVSNHAEGGVFHVAQQYQVPFMHFTGPFNAEEYQKIIEVHGAEWVALSGWLKLAAGLDPQRTINIHPGPLPRFGGKGMYGKHVHAAVVEAFKAGEVTTSHVTMHFVTPQYDEGPVIFRCIQGLGSGVWAESPRREVIRSSAGAGVVYPPFLGSFA